MAEFLGDKRSDAANNVAWMNRTKRALGAHNNSMAEIHSAVARDVELDTSSVDFGRITHSEVAHNMARAIDDKTPIGYTPSWIEEHEVDVQMANEIEAEVGERKAAQDYLITQGYAYPTNERMMDIHQDIHTRSVNPVAALNNIIKSRKTKRAHKIK